MLPGNTQIFTDNAPHSVVLSSSGQAVEGGGGLLTVSDLAGHVVAIGGSGGLRFTEGAGAGGSSIATAAGSANPVTLDGGYDTIDSEGADAISNTVVVSGAAKVYAGTGTLSVFGHSDSAGASVYGNGGSYTLDGDTGNITYYGGALASTVLSRLSNDTLVGGAGHLTVNGGSRETITGGSGGITYAATDGGGANTITTAAGSRNTLALSGPDTVVSHGNDTISAGAGNQTITVDGNSAVTGSTTSPSRAGRPASRGEPAPATACGGRRTLAPRPASRSSAARPAPP